MARKKPEVLDLSPRAFIADTRYDEYFGARKHTQATPINSVRNLKRRLRSQYRDWKAEKTRREAKRAA